jgi:hypothetical protein
VSVTERTSSVPSVIEWQKTAASVRWRPERFNEIAGTVSLFDDAYSNPANLGVLSSNGPGSAPTTSG